MPELPDPAQPLSGEEAAELFGAILDGAYDDDQLGPWLLALAERGETADEIAGAARALRQRMLAISAPAGAIDVCGTGGDGSHSLNVSTAVAFVVAGCGVPVAKHGNRAASSRSGAADVLEALGVPLDSPPHELERQLADKGIAFLFAQRHHPALARLAPLRRRLGSRTIFNLLGPLANPAGVRRQLVGVAHPAWVAPYARALLALGVERAAVVHGGGLDEVALHQRSAIAWVADDKLADEELAPEEAGVGRHPLAALAGGDPGANAARLIELVDNRGEDATAAAYRDAVVLNAAAALRVAGRVAGWREGVELASGSLASGAARARLDSLRR